MRLRPARVATLGVIVALTSLAAACGATQDNADTQRPSASSASNPDMLGTVWVANEAGSSLSARVTSVYDSTVSVIDLPTRRTVATVKVGKKPNGISFTPRRPTPAPARISVALPTPSTSPTGHGDHGGHG